MSWNAVRGRQKLEYFACHIIDRFRRNFVVLDGDLLLPAAVLEPVLSNMGSRTEPARGLIPKEKRKSTAIVNPVFS